MSTEEESHIKKFSHLISHGLTILDVCGAGWGEEMWQTLEGEAEQSGANSKQPLWNTFAQLD